jgi:hypothetical protein
MRITSLAKLSFLGIVDIDTVKRIDTFFHGLFRPAAVAGVVVALSIIAGLAQPLVAVNYAISDRVVWPADLLEAGPVVFVAVSLFTLVGLSIFFLTFSKALPSRAILSL